MKTKSLSDSERGVASFVTAHRQDVTGVLSGWDRLRFLRFLGSKEPRLQTFQGEVTSDAKRREEGMRLKHRRQGNSLKMYDKQGQVLRVETTIVHPEEFKVYWAKEGDPQGPKSLIRKIPVPTAINSPTVPTDALMASSPLAPSRSTIWRNSPHKSCAEKQELDPLQCKKNGLPHASHEVCFTPTL